MDIIFNSLLVFLTLFPAYFLGVFNLKSINYYAILFWFSLVFCLIGAFIIRSGAMDDSFFVAPIADKADAKELGLSITCLSFFLFFLFSWLTEVFYNGLAHGFFKCKVEWGRFVSSPLYKSTNAVSIGLLILSCFLVIYYFLSISPAPLLMAINGSSAEEVALRRLAVTKDYQGIGYFRTLALIVPTILSYYYVIKLVNHNKKILILILTLFSFVLSVITLILNGEKSPLIFYFLGLLVTYSSVRPLKIRTIFLFLICTTAVVVFMYVILFQFGDIRYIL